MSWRSRQRSAGSSCSKASGSGPCRCPSLIIVIGLYGALAVARYHERADYHLLQARALTRVLVDAGALADHDTVLEESRQAHYLKYPRLQHLRLNRLWIGLHAGVAAYGVVLVVITFLVQ